MIVNFYEYNNIPSIFYYQSNDMKDQPYLWKKENDKYVSLSWLQVKEQVESLATYLIDLGILEGDRVLILSENVFNILLNNSNCTRFFSEGLYEGL